MKKQLNPTLVDKNCLSYWFPKLQASGVLTPRTAIFHTKVPLLNLLDGKGAPGFQGLVQRLQAACKLNGYPVFLRTGHFSGKCNWKDTCYISKPEDFPGHIYRLVEESQTVDMLGLPVDVWVLRRFLLGGGALVYLRNGMPLRREVRVFFDANESQATKVWKGWIPYWPEGALEGKIDELRYPNWRALLKEYSTFYKYGLQIEALRSFTMGVATAFHGTGAWSLDWMEIVYDDGRRQWYAIDMAEAHRSYGCPKELLDRESIRQTPAGPVGMRGKEIVGRLDDMLDDMLGEKEEDK